MWLENTRLVAFWRITVKASTPFAASPAATSLAEAATSLTPPLCPDLQDGKGECKKYTGGFWCPTTTNCDRNAPCGHDEAGNLVVNPAQYFCDGDGQRQTANQGFFTVRSERQVLNSSLTFQSGYVSVENAESGQILFRSFSGVSPEDLMFLSGQDVDLVRASQGDEIYRNGQHGQHCQPLDYCSIVPWRPLDLLCCLWPFPWSLERHSLLLCRPKVVQARLPVPVGEV